jgi:hypothetical protein
MPRIQETRLLSEYVPGKLMFAKSFQAYVGMEMLRVMYGSSIQKIVTKLSL